MLQHPHLLYQLSVSQQYHPEFTEQESILSRHKEMGKTNNE